MNTMNIHDIHDRHDRKIIAQNPNMFVPPIILDFSAPIDKRKYFKIISQTKKANENLKKLYLDYQHSLVTVVLILDNKIQQEYVNNVNLLSEKYKINNDILSLADKMIKFIDNQSQDTYKVLDNALGIITNKYKEKLHKIPNEYENEINALKNLINAIQSDLTKITV